MLYCLYLHSSKNLLSMTEPVVSMSHITSGRWYMHPLYPLTGLHYYNFILTVNTVFLKNGIFF
jgi:hypothetical protein